MNITEIHQKLIAVADKHPELEAKIKSIIEANEPDIEAKLLALAGVNPILSASLPVVKTLIADLIKARGPVKMQTDSEIKIVFED